MTRSLSCNALAVAFSALLHHRRDARQHSSGRRYIAKSDELLTAFLCFS
jgi:hypothetical protein